MSAPLQAIRFREDRARPAGAPGGGQSNGCGTLPQQLLYSAVIASPATFPRLCQLIETALERLNLQPGFSNYLVNRDSEVQATSVAIPGSRQTALIFSSGLLERLSDDEIRFVIGHELGHLLFQHNLAGLDPSRETGIARLRLLALQRASEISADRVGLLAARNPACAAAALIKTVTGLDERNVRFDIQSFLDQYKRIIEAGPNPLEAASSHPLFLVRIRALLLFSRTSEFAGFIGSDPAGRSTLESVEDSICRDLNRISGLNIQDLEDSMLQQTLVLAAFVVFAADGRLARDEQEFLRHALGDVDLTQAIQTVKEAGLQGLAYQLKIALTAFSSATDRTRMRINSFLGELLRTFPDEHTAFLRETLEGFHPNFVPLIRK